MMKRFVPYLAAVGLVASAVLVDFQPPPPAHAIEYQSVWTPVVSCDSWLPASLLRTVDHTAEDGC
jgi:hypothetical protein